MSFISKFNDNRKFKREYCKAYDLMENKEYEDAETIFHYLLDNNYNVLDVLRCLYEINFDLKRYDEAMCYADKALDISPSNFPALLDKAYIYKAKNDYDNEVYFFNKALEVSKNDYEKLRALDELIYVYRDESDFEKCLQCIDSYLQIDSQNSSKWAFKGLMLYDQGMYDEAVACYNQSLKLDKSNEIVKSGKLLALMNINEEEASSFFSSISKDSNDDAVLNNYGIYCHKTGCLKEAIDYFDKALSINNNSRYWNNKGLVLQDLKEYSEALECYDKSLELDNENISALSNKSTLLNKLGNYEESLNCLNMCLKLNQNCHLCWANKSITLHKLKKYQDALFCIDNAIGLKPDILEFNVIKGRYYLN